MLGRHRSTILVGVSVVLFAVAGPVGVAQASSPAYAPPDRPGPALDVPASSLESSLVCSLGVAGASRDAVLLVPGTTLDPTSNYSWNYERGLSTLGIPWCALTLPYEALGDVATAGEYVVYAIRTMYHESGHQVDILGYSQGGMVPRWALRFWPDTRTMVKSFVAIDPSNHGTLDASVLCNVVCPPAMWQQATGSHFLDALNSYDETFPGIDYTVVYSRTDEIVVPNFDAQGSSSLHTGSGSIENIAVQQICPLDPSEHLLMGTADPVAYALATDALVHSDLADPAEVPADVCSELLSPAVNPIAFPLHFASMLASIALSVAMSPETFSEPALPSYVYAQD
jgi:hypothetical protein